MSERNARGSRRGIDLHLCAIDSRLDVRVSDTLGFDEIDTPVEQGLEGVQEAEIRVRMLLRLKGLKLDQEVEVATVPVEPGCRSRPEYGEAPDMVFCTEPLEVVAAGLDKRMDHAETILPRPEVARCDVAARRGAACDPPRAPAPEGVTWSATTSATTSASGGSSA